MQVDQMQMLCNFIEGARASQGIAILVTLTSNWIYLLGLRPQGMVFVAVGAFGEI